MKFYRYELESYIEHCPTRLTLIEYGLIKETPCGYWIGFPDLHYSKYKKWVSKTNRKRFAYPTKEQALIGYIKRTERRLGILKHHINQCELGLIKANDLTKTLTNK